mmetsp:Transcript_47966/g.111936  ORF Transcript_47966/g.111936 Transcript_47966/m.111936 type:complete len:142 (+) Transcript_47966:89-514(+)
MSLRFIFSLLAASAPPAVHALTCNAGGSNSYSGDCAGFTNADLWVSSTCVMTDHCYTYSYSFDVTSGCRVEAAEGGCGISTSCTSQETAVSLLGSTVSGFTCSSCTTDDCNTMSIRTSGTTSVKVTSVGMLGIVAALVARL